MQNLFYLALPRLHTELALYCYKGHTIAENLPAMVHTLWPGLPHCPDNAWAPQYSWNEGQAQACLQDFMMTAQLGSTGAPIQNYTLDSFTRNAAGLSSAEKQAIQEFSQANSALGFTNDVAAQQSNPADEALLAQRLLILAWYQESQTLELQELEKAVLEKQNSLAQSLKESSAKESGMSILPSGPQADTSLPLPEWEMVLAAAWQFFPQIKAAGKQLCVVVTDSVMAEDLLVRAPIVTEHPAFWPGFTGVIANRGMALGIPGNRENSGKDSGEVLFMFPAEQDS